MRGDPLGARHPVVVHGTHRMPGRRDELWDHQYTLPGRLNEAGITVAIAANERYTGHERNLPYHAGTAAAHGMDPRSFDRDPVRG